MNDIEQLKDKINREYQLLTNKTWRFLNYGWPELNKEKYNTKKLQTVNNIKNIKKIIFEKLGIIPVYYFLAVLFGTMDYKGPYNNVEKGLLILYLIIENKTFEEMDEFISKTTFHQIYKQFFSEKNIIKLNKILNYSLQNMFSNIKLRLLNGMLYNPDLFQQVTLYLDDQDIRGIIYGCENKKDYYSYKLKKYGFRTQVSIDNNGFIVFISDSEPCGVNNDGSMFVQMNIKNKINEMDCIALDGGYSQYTNTIINNSSLNDFNFIYPIRKDRNIDLNHIEVDYNNQFGSFRSKMEKTFAYIGNTFKKFNNKKPFLTTNIKIFNIQYKIAATLVNIKNYVSLNNINPSAFHSYWINDNFDYLYKENPILNEGYINLPNIDTRINNLEKMRLLQKQFLGIQLNEIELEDSIINNNKMDLEDIQNNGIRYEVERIVEHQGVVKEDCFYLVKWKNYDDTENTWEHYSAFDTKDCINDYWNFE